MSNNYKFLVLTFEELTTIQLYEILYLREQVFNVEQDINSSDLDKIDYRSTHVMIMKDEELVGYCRLYEVNDLQAKIGRVVVHKNYRGQKLATKLVSIALEELKGLGYTEVLVRGQAHLVKLYCNCGFEVISEVFQYEGIPHLDFSRKL